MRIEDSTGKFIEAANDAADVLKGLISSLKGATTNKSKMGGADSTAAKIDELTKMNKKSSEQLHKAIEDLPKEFAEAFTKEVGDIGDWIKEIRDFMKDITKKREGKMTNGGARAVSDKNNNLGRKDLTTIEKLMEGVKIATEKTERIFGKKGSGYTHDIYCQTELIKTNELLSEILRKLGGHPGRTRGRASGKPATPPSAGGSPTENLLEAGRKSGLDASPGGDLLGIDVGSRKTFSNLSEEAELLVYGINRISKGTRDWATDLNVIATAGSELAFQMDFIEKGIKDGSKEHDKLIVKHEKEAAILQHVSSIWKDLGPLQRSQLKDMVKQLDKLKEQGISAKAVRVEYEKILDKSKKIARNHKLINGSWEFLDKRAKDLVGHVAAISTGFMGMKFLGGMFDGFKEGVSQLAQDSGAMRSLLVDKSWAKPGEYFNELLQVSTEVVDQIGQAPLTIRKAWVSNIKKGVNNLEDMKESLNSGLALSTAIGSNAESTANEFQKWNMHLGMGSKQTANLARNIRMASTATGVMGDEMLKAASAARELAQEMNNAGLDADKIADGLMRMTAASQKFGVDKQVNELMRAASSLDQFMSSSSEMKNLIAQSGQGARVLGGEGMNNLTNQKQTMMAVSDMMKNEFRRMGAVNAEGNVDTSKLSPQQLTQMDLVFRRRFGKNIGVGESQRMIKAIEDANMTTEEKMNKLTDQMATNNNLTSAEKKSMEEQLKILKEQKKLEKNVAVVNALSSLSEEAKKKDSSFDSMQKTLEDQAKQAQARGITLNTDMSKITEEGIQGVNERLKKAGQKELNQDKLMMKFNTAKSKGDKAGMRDVLNEISDADTKATTLTKKNSNIIDKAQQAQFKMQARLQKWAGQAVQLLGFLPVSVMYLSAIASSMVGTKMTLRDIARFTRPLSKRGSAYTHDIHSESWLKRIFIKLGGNAKGPPPLWMNHQNKKGPPPLPQQKEGWRKKITGGIQDKIQGLGGLGKVTAAFGAAGIAIGAISGLFALFTQHSEKLQKALEPLTGLFNKFMGAIGDLFAPLVDRLVPLFEQHIARAMPMAQMMVDLLGEVFTVFVDLYKVIAPLGQALNSLSFSIIKVLFKMLKPVLMLLALVLKVAIFPLQMLAKALEVVAIAIEYMMKPMEWMGDAIGWVSDQFTSLTDGGLSDISDFFKGVFAPVITKVSDYLSRLKAKFQFLFAILKEKLLPIIAKITSVFRYLQARFREVYNLIKMKFTPIFERLQRIFNKVQDRLKTFISAIEAGFERLKKLAAPILFVLGVLYEIGSAIAEFIWDYLVPSMDLLSTALDVVLTPLNLFTQGIESLSDMLDSVNPFSESKPGGGGTSTGRKILNTVVPIAGIGSMLGFADGGLITKAGEVGSEPVPIVAHAGEAILNAKQQNVVSDALMAGSVVNAKQNVVADALMTGSASAANTESTVSSNVKAANTESTASSSNASGMSDLDERIERRVQNSRPPAAMTAANEELIKIAINSESLVQIATDSVEILEKILSELKTNTSSNDTELNVKPRMKSNYYTWKQARYNDGPQKQYVNGT